MRKKKISTDITPNLEFAKRISFKLDDNLEKLFKRIQSKNMPQEDKEIPKQEHKNSEDRDILGEFKEEKKSEKSSDEEEDDYFDQPLMKVHRMSIKNKELGKIINNLKKEMSKSRKFEPVSIDKAKAERMAQNFFRKKFSSFSESKIKSEDNIKNTNDIAKASPIKKLNNIRIYSINDNTEEKQNIINNDNNIKAINEGNDEYIKDYKKHRRIVSDVNKSMNLKSDVDQNKDLPQKEKKYKRNFKLYLDKISSNSIKNNNIIKEPDKNKKSINNIDKNETKKNNRINNNERIIINKVYNKPKDIYNTQETNNKRNNINNNEKNNNNINYNKYVNNLNTTRNKNSNIKTSFINNKLEKKNTSFSSKYIYNKNGLNNTTYTNYNNNNKYSNNKYKSNEINYNVTINTNKKNLNNNNISFNKDFNKTKSSLSSLTPSNSNLNKFMGRVQKIGVPSIGFEKIKKEKEKENEEKEDIKALSSYRKKLLSREKKNSQEPKVIYKAVIRVNKANVYNKDNNNYNSKYAYTDKKNQKSVIRKEEEKKVKTERKQEIIHTEENIHVSHRQKPSYILENKNEKKKTENTSYIKTDINNNSKDTKSIKCFYRRRGNK